MSNSVRVSATFSFRGKTLHPEMRLDLDQLLAHDGRPDDIHAMLATVNDIDHYSYEYEMLQAEPLVFDEPRGLASDFVKNGQMDWAGLSAAWSEQRLLEELSDIARRHMDIDSLKDLPGLQATLMEAYLAGQKHSLASE
ncbi:hypothetical protein [Thiolapillus sp.]